MPEKGNSRNPEQGKQKETGMRRYLRLHSQLIGMLEEVHVPTRPQKEKMTIMLEQINSLAQVLGLVAKYEDLQDFQEHNKRDSSDSHPSNQLE